MEKVKNYARFLVDSGLLFEINRQILHPLGLALSVDVDPDNSKWLAIDGIYKVSSDDKEGFIFDEETFKLGARKLELFMLKEGSKKIEDRKESLGYVVQELSSFEEEKSDE